MRRDENNNYNALPQDYSDMLGWDELVLLADKAWAMVEDKEAAFIYCENYGEAGAIMVIGKKYNLPEAVSFSDNFRYWAPREFDKKINEVVYINSSMDEDIQALFSEVRKVGSISNPLAREYGVAVYLCRKPKTSSNKFWEEAVEEME